jgi:polar amino acid transport system substrate-binding protein
MQVRSTMALVSPVAAALGVSLLCVQSLQADTLSEIRERGSLRVGVSEFHPWTYRNPDGELEGFEVEVGRRVAQAMGVEPEFRVYIWDEIIDAVEANEIDVIAAGMAITPLRAQRVDFSNAYSEAGFTMVANTQSVPSPVADIKDLDRADFTVAVVDATLSGQAAPLFFDRAELIRFADPREAEEAILSGDVDVYATSLPEANILTTTHAGRLGPALEEPLPGVPAGFAVMRGNDSLVEFFNVWIAGSDVRQWLESEYERWFVTID